MRILPFAALAVATQMALPAAAQDLTARASALRDKALADTTAWDVVESLTTEVGARPVGSPAAQRARDWGVAKLKALGFENVHVEAFTTPAWSRGAESAEVVGPFPQTLHILGLGRSSPTPAGGLTAPIAVFHTYREFLAQPAGSLAGKIAVVTEKMIRTQDGSGYGAINAMRTQGPVEAAKRGAVGYLIRSLSTDDTRLPHAGSANAGGIPAAALSTPDAELLDHMSARGQPVTVRLAMASTYRTDAAAWNVVGEIRGREAPDEVLSWAATWTAGTQARGPSMTARALPSPRRRPSWPAACIRAGRSVSSCGARKSRAAVARPMAPPTRPRSARWSWSAKATWARAASGT